MPALARPRTLPAAVPVAIGLAWLVAIAAEASGKAAYLHHDALIGGGHLPLVAALGVFLLAWQLMIAAMMLPSTLPMVRLFRAASVQQPQRAGVLAAFVGGYALVWTLFGAAAFGFDVMVHRTVDATPWLRDHPFVVAGATLTLAGLFQFSDLKDRCLDKCRHPAAYLLQHYRRGIAEAFRMGRGHGLFCLGCCWALMLLMFAAGVANLAWMGLLTAVMIYEKVGGSGRRFAGAVGVLLVVWGVFVLVHAAWLPAALSGVS